MKYCPNCGEALSDNMKFCVNCGTSLRQPEPPAAPPPPEVVPAAPVVEAPAEPTYTPPVRQAPVQPTYAPPVQQEPVQPVYAQPVQPVYAAPVGARPEKKPKKARKKGCLWIWIVILALILGAAGAAAYFFLGSGSDVSGRYDALSGKEDWIELKSSGKATLYVMDTTFSCKWELDGEKFTLEQSGDTYTGTLREGVLNIDLGGRGYVFAKEGAVPQPETFKAVTMISGGQILDEELMDSIGGCYLRFHGDGTGTFYLFGDKAPVTYDGKAMTVDGETIEYTIKDDTLEFTYPDGSGITMKRTTQDPEQAETTNGWEGNFMETDLQSFASLPGQPFAQLDLGETSVSFADGNVTGTLWLDEAQTVTGMLLFLHEISYEDARDQLTAAYGEPTTETEEPYVESNGGAVTLCHFDHPAGTLILSSASEEAFLKLTLQEK